MSDKIVKESQCFLNHIPVKTWRDISRILKERLETNSFLPCFFGENNKNLFMLDTKKPGKTVILYLNLEAPKVIEACTVGTNVCDYFARNHNFKGRLGILFQGEQIEQEREIVSIEEAYLLGLTFSPGIHIPDGMAASYVIHNIRKQLVVRIAGLTAHGSAPHLGINSLDAAALAVNAASFAASQLDMECKVRPLWMDTGKGAINMIPDHTDLILEVEGKNAESLEQSVPMIKTAMINAVESVFASIDISEEPLESWGKPIVSGKAHDILNNCMRQFYDADDVVSAAQATGADEFHILNKKYHCDGAYMGIPLLSEENTKETIDKASNIIIHTVQCLLGEEDSHV